MTKRPEDYRTLLSTRPFEPFTLCLTDGRKVTIRHPDQAIVYRTHFHIGLRSLGPLERSGKVATSDAVPETWLNVNLMHIVSVGPAQEKNGSRKRRRSSRS